MSTLTDVSEHDINTPFGKPSAPLISGKLAGQPVVFLARHGIGHAITPTEVNYRANIHALKQMGVHRIVSVSACGSLREKIAPGHIVVPDQLVDFTRDRQRSFFGDGLVAHITAADPFCEDLGGQLLTALEPGETTVHAGGTFITIEGPRFSTRAESHLYRQWNMSIIGMTTSPEAFLAREAEMCYAVMAHVTDYDVWHTSEAPVTVEMVMRILDKNTAGAQGALTRLAESLGESKVCHCESALGSALVTDPQVVPEATSRRLELLVKKYCSPESS
jgi:5'-methylthioadenosine phosphorylase